MPTGTGMTPIISMPTALMIRRASRTPTRTDES